MAEFKCTKTEVEKKLKRVMGKTLGEVDINRAFDKTIGHPKVTGIAGDVVEKSVLGYPSNSAQNPDLSIDGILTEVKTTGVRYSKKSLKKKRQKVTDFEAKEPMSITAVSPEKIVSEQFDSSNFWKKLQHTLLVYYHYNSPVKVQSDEYRKFKFVGYDFHEFSDEDKKLLESDWTQVRAYIQQVQSQNNGNRNNIGAAYHEMGSKLRGKLAMINLAPAWPNRPRFRLTRQAVSAMVSDCFSRRPNVKLNDNIDTLETLNQQLHQYAEQYRGKTVRQLCDELHISFKPNKNGDAPKNITEKIFLRMCNSKARSLNRIDLFRKAGIQLKTVVNKNYTSKNAEDTKMFNIDFNDFYQHDVFEDSQFYTYFKDTKFLLICFRKTNKQGQLLDNIFKGFKLVVFSDSFIDQDVKKAWNSTRDRVINQTLKKTMQRNKKGEIKLTPKTKVPKTSLNFIKSSENSVFVRGTGSDATDLPETVNNISMYFQFIWVKRQVMVEMSQQSAFI